MTQHTVKIAIFHKMSVTFVPPSHFGQKKVFPKGNVTSKCHKIFFPHFWLPWLKVKKSFWSLGPMTGPKSAFVRHPPSSALVRTHPHSSALVRTHPHSSALVRIHPHSSALVRIHPHSSAFVRIHPHSSAFIRICPHSSAFVRIRPHSTACGRRRFLADFGPVTGPNVQKTFFIVLPSEVKNTKKKNYDFWWRNSPLSNNYL